MQLQPQVTFRNVKPTEEVQLWIGRAFSKLESLYNHIMGCRVEIQLPRQHRKNGCLYQVRIDLTLPGGEIVVKREPKLRSRARPLAEGEIRKDSELSTAQRDLQAAINDAFKVAGRRLQDYARRQRGDVKTHTGPARTRDAKMG